MLYIEKLMCIYTVIYLHIIFVLIVCHSGCCSNAYI